MNEKKGLENKMANIRRIGVLTSGGDAPGMNNAVRAVTLAALSQGIEVIGIMGGYSGLVNDNVKVLTAKDVSDIVTRGGTALYSDRCLEFKTEEGMAKAVATCKKYQIDGIIACGGDGTFRGATDLSNLGIPTIGIPCTIDNDITSTDYAIGYDTAMNTVIQMIDRLRDTCESHARCNVVEVMGNHAGGIAVQTAIATGAVGCVIAETPIEEDAIIAKINAHKAEGQRGFIVIVSELIPDYADPAFAKRIQEKTGVETKFARLAHVVRGGDPTLRDRVTAAKMGSRAVKELLDGKSNIVVCEQAGEIVCLDINFAQTADRIYKGKAKPKEIEKYSAEEQAVIMATVEKKQNYFKEMMALVDEIAG